MYLMWMTSQNLKSLDGIICGIPTWNTGADEERSGTAWDSILEDIGELSLSGKKVAIFGLRRFFYLHRKLLRCNGRTS